MLTELPEYPWDAMAPYVAKAKAHPGGAIDLSIGSPVDPTPAVIRDALAKATDSHAYPTTMGTPALREAIVEWFARRRGVTGLGVENVLPTIGSKEFVAWLPFMLRLGPGDVVVHPTAAYPTYDIGTRMAEATPFPSDDPAEWPKNTKLVWLNSPGNPDGRVLDKAQLKARVERARELGAYIVGDECYAELGWAGRWEYEPIPSLLDPDVTGGDLTGILTAYSLSKQSNLAGYRAAFVAGDAQLIAQLTNIRKHAGMMQPGPVQAAMVAALADDAHVAAQKELYRARRDLLIPALNSAGYRLDHSEAGLYLWVTEGVDAWASIDKLAGLGIIAGPGVFYGDFYPQHVRLSLTETDERIAEAARRLMSV
ncbi:MULTISPECIES: succinyldiaminopimelate transaminase [Aurantimicrobium]|uniref:Aminotransferase n=1 Tax=Aurantimicrobium photophilum TaxID=1987356 RepID=A0A2Z3RZA1_9MICO|nr:MULTISPECIES: succinyldiaminopimelate transaminase [Aurantimicrobium]AWR21800.1 LL-diaminopimelate aminotransferase [Aurantimicrobium photophilum]MDH6255758.1 succinyldiaminopimelate transaminase [Aurantimicrobium minutum]